jgi:hypothetical protein
MKRLRRASFAPLCALIGAFLPLNVAQAGKNARQRDSTGEKRNRINMLFLMTDCRR